MEIKDIQGNILIDALVTEQAVKVDELMKQYSITLSWVSVTDEQLPLGAYIEHEGVRYSLLALYNPEQSDEATYTYKPVFEHPIMRWQHIPFFFYTYSEGKVISKELDWSLTDNPANFMKAVCDAILNETGEDWSYEISADLPASASLSFSNTDIFSGLNTIAGVFKTEWWFDYANKIVYLSKAAYGDAVTLEVGQNIGIPSKNQSKGGYYTRFYAFGSTRNIEQSYAGSNVNSIVNRRLTLNPEKYPNGYIDIREGLTESEILVKTLVFDDIYPRSSLTISDVKVRLMWRLDDNSEKVQIGTDSDGNPVYDQYAIWYFKIPELSFSKDMLIEGKALSVHFNSGALNGREFELTYHDTAKEVTTSDGTSIQVEVGDYEINFIEEGTYIIPAITGLIPMEGDSVTLFNIVMPEEYKVSAYEELEQEVRKEIAKQGEDRNNYTFGSNKVAFFESNPNLAVGRNVLYKNGSTTLATRVIRLETQLDYAFEQKITIGNEQIKGTTQTLKEEVVNANQSIDLLAAINENTEAFQQSLQRTQKAVLDSLAKWGDMWVLDPANGAVRTRYNVIADGTIAMKDLGDGGSGEVAQGNLDNLSNVQISNPSNGDVLTYDEVNDIWVNKVVKSGLDETELKSYLTTNQYAKLSDIPSLDGYALASDLTALRTDFDNLNTLLNGNVGGVIDTWNEVVSFLDGYSQSDDLATILSGMNSDIGDRVLIEDFEKLEGSVTDISNRVKTFEDVIGIDSNGDVYIKGTRNFYTEGGTISMFGLGEGDSGEVASVSIKFEGSDDVYSAVGGIITLPAYPSGGGGVADSVDWANVENKPNFATVATSGKYSDLTGVPTSLPASDVYSWAKAATKPLYAFSEITSKPTTLAGYGITDNVAIQSATNNLMSYTNEFNFASDAYSGEVYINWRTAGDAPNGNISYYNFLRGAGHVYAALVASSYVIYGGTSSQFLKADGSLDGTAYLPLSGGTFNFPSETVSATSNPRIGRFDRGAGSLVFQVGTSNIFDIVDSGWINVMLRVAPDEFSYYGNNIIHSGNIGSQSVNYANSAARLDTTWYEDCNYTATSNLKIIANVSGVNGNYPAGYVSGLSVMSSYVGWQLVSYGGGMENPYFRSYQDNGTWKAWRQLAFLTDNVASATKLQTARSIWGQSFDGTGDVWGRINIRDSVALYHYTPDGSSILCYMGHDYVNPYVHIYNFRSRSSIRVNDDGNICIPNGNILIGTTRDKGGKLQVSGYSRFEISSDNYLLLELATNSLDGNGIAFWSSSGWKKGTINASTLYLNSASYGNVLIGTTSDNGAKLQVNGDISAMGGISSSLRYVVTAAYDATNPVEQAIVINSAGYASTYASWPGIGFHIPGSTYATIKYGSDDVFHFMNATLSGWVDIKVGNLIATGTIAMGTLSSSSDARLKDNIELLTKDESLAVLRQLRPSKWNWKSNGALSYGFIAQEVESVASCMVDRMNDEELGQKLYLQYNQLHAFEVGAIQHIDSEVGQLKRDLNTANLRIEKLENELKQYRLCQ